MLHVHITSSRPSPCYHTKAYNAHANLNPTQDDGDSSSLFNSSSIENLSRLCVLGALRPPVCLTMVNNQKKYVQKETLTASPLFLADETLRRSFPVIQHIFTRCQQLVLVFTIPRLKQIPRQLSMRDACISCRTTRVHKYPRWPEC